MPIFRIRHERQPGGERKFKVYTPWWMDPFWWILGSSIEKMVMAEFVRRGIFFLHAPQTNDLGALVPPDWEADFLLPQYKIWIEVQGSYFHSLPGKIEDDSWRYALIENAGWKPIFWWEFDIRARLPELFDAVPEFYYVDPAMQAQAAAQYGSTPGLPFYEGAFDADGNPIDHLAGLRKALANRTRPPQLRKRRQTRRRPK